MTSAIYQSKRFKWMGDQIQDSFDIPQKNFNVYDVLQSEKYASRLKDFFEGRGENKLIFYFQQGDGNQTDENFTEQTFILTTGEEERLIEKGIFFLRLSQKGKAVNLADLNDEILFGEISPNILNQLNKMMNSVFQTLITNQDKDYWGECDEDLQKEFVTMTDNFTKDLKESIKSLTENVDKCKLDPEEVKINQSKGLLNNYYEEEFKKWMETFHENLKETEFDQNINQNQGPKTELEYWKKVLQKVMLLMEITNTKDFRDVLEYLNQTKNNKGEDKRTKMLNDYQNIENILTERINEAKDNVKYLTTLEKFIEPLYSGSADDITETLPALMNAIKMIHTISRYYNTSSKMTGLFTKITNQIILNCKNKILDQKKHEEIWNFDPEKLIEIFKNSIGLAQKYKQQYQETKNKAAELAKSRHWDFDDTVIFQNLNLFVKRIKKLIELFTTIQQFNTLEKHQNLEGMNKLTDAFKKILEEFKRKEHNLLEIESIKLEKDYVELMQKILKLDGDLQEFINQNFSKLNTISYSLKLLNKFTKILHRDNIRNRLMNKYETILQNYGAEIDMISKVFDDNKQEPPILRNMPTDAGKIIWVRYLFAKLYGPIEQFPPNLISTREMKKYIDKYNLIGQNLIIYELYFTQSWCNDIERAKACLQTALLSVREENGHKKLKVNFEMDIQKLIREAKALDREGIGGIPESAKIILLQEEKFKQYYFELDFIKNEYERIISLIKPIMKNLLILHVEDLDLKLRPGMVTLTWTSMNIDNFIKTVEIELSRLEQLVVIINDIIENRIENNLKMIGKIILVKLPENSKPMSLDEFVETQQNYIKEKAEILISKNTEIERSVDDLIHTVMNYSLDPSVEEFDTRAAKLVKQYYFWYFYQALLNSTQRSLNQMKDRICGKRKNSSKKQKPFFEVHVTLEDGEVKLVPSLDDIQKAINRAATAVLSCSKQMMGWDQIINQGKEEKSSEGKESYYKIIAQDKEIVKVILLLTGSIQGTKNKIYEFLHSFEKYRWLWSKNITEEIKQFSEKNPQLQDYEDELKKFISLENEIGEIEKTREIGAMALKTNKLIDALKSKCKEWKNNYAYDLHSKAKFQLLDLTENIKTFQIKLQKEVKEIDSLGQVMNTLEEIGKEQSEIDLKFGPVFDMYNLLDIYLPGGVVDKEVVENRQLLEKKWSQLIKLSEEKKNDLQKDQGKNLQKLKENIKQLISDVKKLRKNFEEKGPMVKDITPKEASDRLKSFENEYDLKNNIYKTNKRGEDLFGLENQKYEELTKTQKEIKQLKQLYDLYNHLIQEVSEWEEQVWSEIEPQQIQVWEDSIQTYSDNCGKLHKNLREWQAYKELKSKIENFKNILPLIKELKEPMIKDRHWNEIITITKKQLNFAQPENFYFREVIEANLMEHPEEIEDIIDSAKKQDKIERQKNEISQYWSTTNFEFKQWGTNRQVPILSGGCIEEIQEKLDEHISTLSGLIAMRHIGPFKKEVQQLQEMLTEVQKNLDLWVKVQILWTSLERVFTEGDISMILTTESKKFKKIDKDWVKNIMEKAFEQKLVKICCQNEIIKSNLPRLQEDLEACQKQLEKYLEMKRKTFPRFYFVSNPVLLKFLSQGSDPENIQEDFDKLFDAISKVTFNKADSKSASKKITEIKNLMGEEPETVVLQNSVICIDYIEKWLQKLEEEMQISIRESIKKAQNEIFIPNIKMETFTENFPAQVSLICLQLKWTKLIDEALTKKTSEKNKAIPDAKNEINKIMEELTEMCKKDLKTRMRRQKIETLVTIMVYLKDVTNSWKFREVTDFEWQKYTRVYWNSEKKEAQIEITDWKAFYQNEYLGVKERLCITPLTDRCYISLAQAMSMHYGGAPAGPAGTGKTETVKDLGRTLGIFVVVTNCSSEHRYTDMAKIFKGLCQSGLWGCFDEFNRIDLEVLSVVAMQIESITSAKKAGAIEFMFPDETDKIKLISTCGYFITMNPGYAGRQELPENLKVLFRGVTMMVPDREVIIRVKLASCGYSNYAELAKKFKVLYNLCEEQLSKQKHYDFGLRNILSVLRTAGNILREEGEDSKEELILMRTLRDMNFSKLVSADVNLFKDLLKDIFPKITDPGQKSHEAIQKQITKVLDERKLVNHPSWNLKVIQVYETSLVRHGFMLVGPTCSGKTTIMNTLIDSLSGLGENKKYVIQRLNPKAFTSQEMYGVKNFAGEWTPGIFSEIWRKANEKKSNKPINWLVCDGPVDAIWIENLNTVLDDNKVLTLANGDRLFMLDTVKMVFEVENLNNASPATVSRCGQIYVSPEDLGSIQIIQGWINQRTKNDNFKQTSILAPTVPQIFNKEDADKVLQILIKYYEEFKIENKFMDQCREQEIMEMQGVLKTLQVMNMLGGLIQLCLNKKYNKKLTPEDYEKMILFSLMWGIAGPFELEERKKFEELLRQKSNDLLPFSKEQETIFDYELAINDKGIEWKFIQPEKFHIPQGVPFSRLLLPTIDSTRAALLINLLQEADTSILLIGGPGTAKTSSILMYSNKVAEKMLFHRINFSSATQPVHFQMSIESVCETKINKGYGPKDQKLMNVFIDDMSMPEKNVWGDQITLEIVRELIEDSAFYRLEKNERGNIKFIENLRFLAAMNHPGGGRNDIPNRLKHHFFIFNMTLSSKIGVIFEPILLSKFQSPQFTPSINSIVQLLIPATISVWRDLKQILLPTPSKFHYLFNLRDVSRVFKGMVQVSPDTIIKSGDIGITKIKPELFLISLWKHECERVFIDKLINDKDKQTAMKIIENNCVEIFKDYKTDIESQIFDNQIFFCDFLQMSVRISENEEEEDGGGEEEGEYTREYEGIMDIDKLRQKCQLLLKRYNKENKLNQMQIVLFNDALGHLLKITRIIQMPRSSALLVGVGGSGKQSLTRFAANIEGQQVFQIALTKTYGESQFKEDIKNLFDRAGHKGFPITFILTDAEVKDESFLEYLNMVLSTGEIPGLIQKDEREIWLGDVRTEYIKKNKENKNKENKEPTAQEIYDYFLNRLRDNLHVVLCFSPVGTKFRERARKFPALFNECTIDWFLPWPEEALCNVADQFISDFQLEGKDDIKDKLSKWMAQVHKQVNTACEEYYLKMRRSVFVTPKSYLSFIRAYQKLYQIKFDELNDAENKFQIGLQKIQEAKQDIQSLEKELKKEEEKVQKKQEEVKELLKKLEVQKAKADKKNQEVCQEKNLIEKEKGEIEKDKTVCEKELAESLPALLKAQDAANAVTSKDISELKPTMLQKTHIVMKYIADAINIVLYQKVRKDIVMVNSDIYANKKDEDSKKKIEFFQDSWEQFGKQAFFEPGLAEKLQMMAKTENENLINSEILELLEPYTRCVETWFSKSNASNVYSKVALIHDWIIQIEKFSKETRNIKPKRLALKQQEDKLEVATIQLRKAEEQLKVIQKELSELDQQFKSKNNEKAELEEKAKQQKRKIDKANSLIISLSDERERWDKGKSDLAEAKRKLVGNVGLATAFISYCGPFNAEFRNIIANDKMVLDLEQMKIPHNNSIYNELTTFLVDDATVSQWNLDGLPKDVLSIQNGIMVQSSDRFPLLIDPQNQGGFWIKNKYNKNNQENNSSQLFLVNVNEEKKFRDGLTKCVENGDVLILEGIENDVDPILDPILEKKIFKKGTKSKIILGGQQTDYDLKFKLFLTCKLGNPKFSPELSAKTTIIDFTVTQNGLEQQLLSVVLTKKQRVLEESLNNLMKEVTRNKKVLKDLDNTLLQKLTTSKTNLLEDQELIEILNKTKIQAKDMQNKLAESEIKTNEINEKRLTFKPVAVRGSVLYFCLIEIAQVNWMYNSSLNQFLELYNYSIDNSPKTALPQKDVENIITELSYNVYRYVNRGLFEKDKITFLLMLCFKILNTDNKLTSEDISIFLKAGDSLDKTDHRTKPIADWLSEKMWSNILALSLHSFGTEKNSFYKSLPDVISSNLDIWKKWAYDKTDPENFPVPEFEERILNDVEIGSFYRLALIRSIREDRTTTACLHFIKNTFGESRYIEPASDTIESIEQASASNVPVLFLLSAGADPTSSIDELAKKKKKQLQKVSLGEGQERKAESLLQEASEKGEWVLLQNCHLGLNFMSFLDTLLLNEEWTNKSQSDFRIWMSCEPREGFPLGLLQKSIKVTNEPPQGIKAGLYKTFTTLVNSEFLERIDHPNWRILTFATCFLHSVVQERRKFGELGWCIPYEFNFSDLEASLAFIEKYLNQLQNISGITNVSKNFNVSFPVLIFMICEIQYGGKITDNLDRELFNAYGEKYFRDNIFTNGKVYPGKISDFEYIILHEIEHKGFLEYIEKMPPVDNPEIFGLNSNADIAFRTKETKEMISTIMTTRPKESTGNTGMTREEIIYKKVKNLLTKLSYSQPQNKIISMINKLSGPKNLQEKGLKVPLNIFLFQEIQRMDFVLYLVKKTFTDITEAIDGQIIMTPQIVDAIDSLFDGKVPKFWINDPSGAEISWLRPSFPLWFDSLIERNEQIQSWLKNDRPRTFNLGLFFNPQGFLTAMKQEVVRSNKNQKPGKNTVEWSMDNVDYSTTVLSWRQQNDFENGKELFNEGVLLSGLWLEGCKWAKEGGLVDSQEKKINFPLNILHVTAVALKSRGGSDQEKRDSAYNCPVYKYPLRNDRYLIFRVFLNYSGTGDQNKWKLRGVALLCSTDK